MPAQQQSSHPRFQTLSSNALPHTVPNSTSSALSSHQANMQHYETTTRRTLSNATSSTSSSNTALNRVPTNPAQSTHSGDSIRRSISSRSTTSPTSYVALMRKQKATVWCDRAQHEDPRLLAQQRAAKMRAAMEVVGGGSTRTSTSGHGVVGGVRSKIRYHGAVKASAFNSANMSGAGVPMRLSATEVDEGDSDEGDFNGARYHQRNGSGRSSLGSGRRVTAHSHSQQGYSASSTPPSAQSRSPVEGSQPHPMHDLAEEETLVPNHYLESESYFARPTATGLSGGSGSSGGSIQAERGFGDVGSLPQRHARKEEPEDRGGKALGTSADDLRRRGSVDDRTLTMSGVRLFVANPDSDSD
ncbi:hypothetical protein LTR28_004070 [Elasticomyces elasticus]|nr:hypothetical protein LTR28_004070 [Elasticomyces elasticus]